ncbi:MAG: hypothetical protein M3385_07175 [Actinomycetota bacterium]|nr:hypothetical protein [Actinomycetota bacterium]
MDGKRARPLMRSVAALALAMSLAVAGACGANTLAEKASAAKDKSPEKSTKAANSTASGSSSRGGLPQGSEPVRLGPADFSVNIDNPYWPMSPGSKWVYSETDTTGTNQKVVVEVTDEKKMIANGIEARVIRDTVTENGQPVEITDDWYAQDKAGNIWYLGEYVTNYKNGKVVDHGGSFEAGIDGAQPGIAMPANPEPGLSYRQEYYKGEAEDKAAVITVGEERVQVPFGYFDKHVLMTRDLVPTEPKVQELKFYSPNVGPLLSVHTDGDGGRAELVSYSRAG